MFAIAARRFRVFDDTDLVPIRPLTLLTGGNSAGKTSFLAALRYLGSISHYVGGAPSSFNKDPFFLGAYDQIAHHRGGRYGRASSFAFAYKGPVLKSPYGSASFKRDLPEEASFVITFGKRVSQPAIKAIEITSDPFKLKIEVSQDWKSVRVRSSLDGESIDVTTELNKIVPASVNAEPGMLIYAVEAAVRAGKEDAGVQEILRAAKIAEFTRAILASVPTAAVVGAPVRSKPSRTYDPTDVSPQAEGSHVPSQLAQLARNNPQEWARIRASLQKFGAESSLFSDIEVRTLGSGESDPFQINITINGPKRNIVDVGYGVSQSLPVIYDVITRPQGDMYLMQQPEVHLHPEAQAALGSFIANDIESKPGYFVVETHSDFLIDRIRRHVREGRLKPEQVSILYFHRNVFDATVEVLSLNSKGEIEDPPENYRGFFLKEEMRNLGFENVHHN